MGTFTERVTGSTFVGGHVLQPILIKPGHSSHVEIVELRCCLQVTPKGQGRERCWNRIKDSLETLFSALWINCFFCAFSIISLFATAVKMTQSNSATNQQAASPFQTPVVLCMAWVAYNTMPHMLLIIWSMLHTPAYATADQRCEEHQQVGLLCIL